ncbi:MAG: hypothetical protein WBE18_05260 [Gammaproteobacteria bacterium]
MPTEILCTQQTFYLPPIGILKPFNPFYRVPRQQSLINQYCALLLLNKTL